MTSLAERAVTVSAELETAREALAAAEHEAERKLGEGAGAEALGELEAAEARRKRESIEEGLASKRERVDTLAQALPEIERRVQAEAGSRGRATCRREEARPRLEGPLLGREEPGP